MELYGIRGALPFAAFGGEARLAGGAAAEPPQQRPGPEPAFPAKRAVFPFPGQLSTSRDMGAGKKQKISFPRNQSDAFGVLGI